MDRKVLNSLACSCGSKAAGLIFITAEDRYQCGDCIQRRFQEGHAFAEENDAIYDRLCAAYGDTSDEEPIDVLVAARMKKAEAEVKRLKRVSKWAEVVMEMLEKHGSGIVPHLLDTDDNPGQELREALADARG